MRISSESTELVYVTLSLADSDGPLVPDSVELGFSLDPIDPPQVDEWYPATYATGEASLLVGPLGDVSWDPNTTLYVWLRALSGAETLERRAGRLIVYP